MGTRRTGLLQEGRTLSGGGEPFSLLEPRGGGNTNNSGMTVERTDQDGLDGHDETAKTMDETRVERNRGHGKREVDRGFFREHSREHV